MLEDLFRNKSKKIKIYMAKEIIDDPYEKNIILTKLNPLSIRALVSDLIFSQIQWKMPGIVADTAKEIIVEKRYRSLLEQSQKIKIDGSFFEGWRVNGKFQLREEGDFLRVYIYSKHV